MEQSRTVIKQFYINNQNCFAIIDKKIEKCIGSLTFISNEKDKSISFGIVINKKYWGRGIGTRVLGYAIDFSFNHLEVEKVRCEHFYENKASEKMMKKAGMYYVGEGEDFLRNVKKYEIDTQTWKRAKQSVIDNV
jgi:RimJ/RimL family protein N-acetyltransferase